MFSGCHFKIHVTDIFLKGNITDWTDSHTGLWRTLETSSSTAALIDTQPHSVWTESNYANQSVSMHVHIYLHVSLEWAHHAQEEVEEQQGSIGIMRERMLDKSQRGGEKRREIWEDETSGRRRKEGSERGMWSVLREIERWKKIRMISDTSTQHTRERWKTENIKFIRFVHVSIICFLLINNAYVQKVLFYLKSVDKCLSSSENKVFSSTGNPWFLLRQVEVVWKLGRAADTLGPLRGPRVPRIMLCLLFWDLFGKRHRLG